MIENILIPLYTIIITRPTTIVFIHYLFRLTLYIFVDNNPKIKIKTKMSSTGIKYRRKVLSKSIALAFACYFGNDPIYNISKRNLPSIYNACTHRAQIINTIKYYRSTANRMPQIRIHTTYFQHRNKSAIFNQSTNVNTCYSSFQNTSFGSQDRKPAYPAPPKTAQYIRRVYPSKSVNSHVKEYLRSLYKKIIRNI